MAQEFQFYDFIIREILDKVFKILTVGLICCTSIYYVKNKKLSK